MLAMILNSLNDTEVRGFMATGEHLQLGTLFSRTGGVMPCQGMRHGEKQHLKIELFYGIEPNFAKHCP